MDLRTVLFVLLFNLVCSDSSYGKTVNGLVVDSTSSIKYRFVDEDNRQYIPRGFVFVSDDFDKFDYSKVDYQRAVRMGANFQVIKISLARLGGWPGCELDDDYLKKLDNMVDLAANYQIRTCFQMTFYSVPKFRHKIHSLWKDMAV